MDTKTGTVLDQPPLYRHEIALGSSPLTVRQVTAKYESEGMQSVYPGYRALIEQMILNGRKTDFDNDSYLDALFLTDIMFRQSRHRVRILSGALADGFLTTLRASLISTLERVQKNGGFVKVILLSNEAPSMFDELKKQFASTFDFALAKVRGQVKHFIVCDSTLARIEEPHEPITPDSPSDIIKAKVYFNEPDQSKKLEDQFDYAWGILRPANAKG
jgi:hypothetical protein